MKSVEHVIYDCIKIVKPAAKDLSLSRKLVNDLGFESIDIIDLFFEIQNQIEVELDLNEIALSIGQSSGRRFNEITVSDIVEYIQKKKN